MEAIDYIRAEDEGNLRLGCCARLTMSDTQFREMPERMRRNLFERVYFVDTPTYSYCLGAMGDYWTLARRPRGDTSNDNVEIIDKWL